MTATMRGAWRTSLRNAWFNCKPIPGSTGGAACACTTERTAMRRSGQPCGGADGRPGRISGWKACGNCVRLSRLCAPVDRCRLLRTSRTLSHVDARWRTLATVSAAFEALPQAG